LGVNYCAFTALHTADKQTSSKYWGLFNVKKKTGNFQRTLIGFNSDDNPVEVETATNVIHYENCAI